MTALGGGGARSPTSPLLTAIAPAAQRQFLA